MKEEIETESNKTRFKKKEKQKQSTTEVLISKMKEDKNVVIKFLMHASKLS